MRFDRPLRTEKIVQRVPRKILGVVKLGVKTVHFWKLLEDYRFYFDDEHPNIFIFVKAGEMSDLASVPKIFGSFIQKDGPFAQPAFTHDYSYRRRGDVVWKDCPDGGIEKGWPLTRKQQDKAFLDGMEICFVGLPTRIIMWRAVRRFGWIRYPKESNDKLAKA